MTLDNWKSDVEFVAKAFYYGKMSKDVVNTTLSWVVIMNGLKSNDTKKVVDYFQECYKWLTIC